ncbi:precorrin-3B synthase [Pseudanabaena mucicola]|uniref:precorrin-3B synthase n=1 Tax=Pseudanabaena mucicola TaxID=71190 RepID=UPI0016804D51|nr:precorrin-3B synthase [Pseudanabaena mucicola]
MQSTTAICPSLFNATTAQDGILSRIRFPAGLITATQCEVLTQVVKQFGNDQIQITNRANLQIRTSQALIEEVLLDFQDYGLASSTESTDGLRNIMASPSAGIDPHAKINIIPFVKAWNFYLSQHPELAILSNKFSVCFDGSEAINVSDRPNDICLIAVEINDEIYFELHLGLGDRGDAPTSVNILIPHHQVLEVLAALTDLYRQFTEQQLEQKTYLRSRPPRLRDLIHDWGVEKYLDRVEQKLGYVLRSSSLDTRTLGERGTRKLESYSYLGIHPQKQLGLFYIGVVVPLGRLTAAQFQGLGNLAKQYGGGALRLTPWQNLLITNIAEADIEQVTQEILNLGLFASANHPYAAITACSGFQGCKAAHTDTQSDAKRVAAYLENCIKLDQPINIHFSGCEKSCAQHYPSDIALVGIQAKDSNNSEVYRVYVGDGDTNFGRELYSEYAAQDIPILIAQMLEKHQNLRQNPQQTFREFINQTF